MRRKVFAVSVGVVLEIDTDLFHIVYAANALGFGFCASQGREDHCGENGNDGDDDEEFDESEGARSVKTRTLNADFCVRRRHIFGYSHQLSKGACGLAFNGLGNCA